MLGLFGEEEVEDSSLSQAFGEAEDEDDLSLGFLHLAVGREEEGVVAVVAVQGRLSVGQAVALLKK